jgi:hypothetical protein
MTANLRKLESATAPKLSRENSNPFKILTDVAAICYELSRQDFRATKRDKTHELHVAPRRRVALPLSIWTVGQPEWVSQPRVVTDVG